MYCKVLNCRYPNYHTTSGHRCGKCGKFGHGQMECGDNTNNLVQYLHNIIPLDKQCTVIGCKYKHNHMKESHLCQKCNRLHYDECIIQNFDVHFNRFDMLQSFNIPILDVYNNVFVQCFVGMGCFVYIRKKDNMIQSLFMHSDNWGQYGVETNNQPVLNKFIENLNELNIHDLSKLNNKIFKCPLCRTLNNSSQILEIKGSSDKCVCCMVNNVELYLFTCKHACLCNNCLIKIKNT